MYFSRWWKDSEQKNVIANYICLVFSQKLVQVYKTCSGVVNKETASYVSSTDKQLPKTTRNTLHLDTMSTTFLHKSARIKQIWWPVTWLTFSRDLKKNKKQPQHKV